MKQHENENIKEILEKIAEDLQNPESALYIERITTHRTLEDGTVLLDKNNPKDREWYEDDSTEEK
ncbi:hypothetical protein [Rossellomorea marisflavi]|uniref:hypothetical protein n=1 Tax=Rossellomorea marisflavi TaxID=189381 RepID=UPI003FA128B8